ncbi:hypothetical protein JIN85_11935 [Luteolibacter pohnpeiensis]|uniref:Xylose isomerase-like TIM barrel domain-containing protein n=1 Tax=Luteolibacter pohnpeiensis TaxID=454153 RepID=A0A934VRF1_9BACT|nr:hypothetical protein [Luteolibacter pohnpeiensis]MBK1883131.1 hypothetical protein [Luteolibacter pohnpeiensis]
MSLALKAPVKVGIIPTHIKFFEGLAPGSDGKLPRNDEGVILTVAEMERFCEQSPVRPSCVQIPVFAATDPGDSEELMAGLRALGLEVQLILMVGGANPMDPADEDAVVGQLVTLLKSPLARGIKHVSSTSIEEWLNGRPRLEGEAYEAAVAQCVRVHTRAYEEAGLANSSIRHWHLEFLCPGEFTTFTDARRCWDVVAAANQALGKTFFKVLVDAAHCGDSDLSIPENEQLIAEIAAADELGVFHCSAKSTRGCFSTDDGWIGALLTAAAKTGKLEYVFVEILHHQDPMLEPLRQRDPNHAIDTTDGRSYTQTTIDALTDTTHRLNNLVMRGIFK